MLIKAAVISLLAACFAYASPIIWVRLRTFSSSLAASIPKVDATESLYPKLCEVGYMEDCKFESETDGLENGRERKLHGPALRVVMEIRLDPLMIYRICNSNSPSSLSPQ